MKNYIKIFVAALALAALASCSGKVEYKTPVFVSLNEKSMEVKEDVGTLHFSLSAYNITRETTVTLALSGTAKSGEDFRLQPEYTGVFTFQKPGVLGFDVEILPHAGVYTGNKTLTISIISVTEGCDLGAITSSTLTILDLDIPVDWDFFAGTWDAEDMDIASGASLGSKYKVTISKVDETRFSINNLYDGGETLMGTVAFDTATNTASIELDPAQIILKHSQYGDFTCYYFDLEYYYTAKTIPGTVSASGVTIGKKGEYGYIALCPLGSFDDGCVTALTKE